MGFLPASLSRTPSGSFTSSSGSIEDVSLLRIFGFSVIAVGLQFGWALQLSLLTPYVQELGIPHQFASYIWLCGPVSGMLLHPTIGYFSDRCRSKWGRRRPFIVGGSVFIVISVILIAFSSDIGHRLGDPVDASSKTRSIVFYVLGFWLLDLANNTLLGPCRALMADYTAHSVTRSRRANAFFTLFMSVGNVLGYGTGAYSGWHKVFRFTKTTACDNACANLKSAFLIDVVVFVVTTVISLSSLKELTLKQVEELQSEVDRRQDPETGKVSPRSDGFWEFLLSVRHIVWELKYIMMVMALTWIAWYPFVIYDTDWMGVEIYKGDSSGKNQALKDLYDKGVRTGAFGLMINSVVLGLMSLVMEPLCRKVGGGIVWGGGNFVMALCYIVMVCISKYAKHPAGTSPSSGLVAGTLVLFAFTGVTLAVTYTVPYIVAMNYINSIQEGQGLAMGILNQACVIPQLILSFVVGPWDARFGGGNLPAFDAAIAIAFISAFTAWLTLPRLNCCKRGGDDELKVAPSSNL